MAVYKISQSTIHSLMEWGVNLLLVFLIAVTIYVAFIFMFF